MGIIVKKIVLVGLFTLFICSIDSWQVLAENNVITVYRNREMGVINKKVLGNNFIGYDPTTYEDWTKEYYGYSDNGAGMWNPKKNEPVKEVIDLAKTTGIAIARFPGGCGAHHYNWKNAIGKNRKHFLFGIDEFLKTCEEIGAEAVFTLSYFTGNEQDAVDLVEYLNAPNNGKHKWAGERAKNGHPQPYRVKYFEVGNEEWHGDHRAVKVVMPEDYAHRYLKYYEAMKAVDSAIKIGVILYVSEWNTKVLNIIKDRLDFAIIHTYPAPEVDENELGKMAAKDIFRITLATVILNDEVYFQETLKFLKEESGKDIPLAITEYNGGFVQDEPIPYRHCLGTALLNAELLRIFMKPEHKILMANYWQFCNSYWGMVYSKTDFMEHDYQSSINYTKRPNYYVYELYNNHFGDILIAVDIKSDSYKIKTKPSFKDFLTRKSTININKPVSYLSVNASKNANGDKIYLMVINKNMDENITCDIKLKDFIPADKGEAWVLNGPSVAATNEENPDNVKVAQREFEIKGNNFEFIFQPHSLTAIEIQRKNL